MKEFQAGLEEGPLKCSQREHLRNNLIKPYENEEMQRCDQVKHNVLKPIPELGEGNPHAWL